IAYFFPHLALFVNGDSKEQRERYLHNWLVSQSAWITRLLISDPSPVVPRCWHDFLNTIPAMIASTCSGRQLQASADLFGPDFVRVTQTTASEVQFQDITLDHASIGQIDDTTKGKILWDLYEHNFQFEFLALDCLLVPQAWSDPNNSCLDEVRQVFPGDELSMCVEPFLTKNQGLVSQEPAEKRCYIEKFRVLLSSWPGFPSDLTLLMPSATSACVWTVEKHLAQFYTQSFFDNFGHPPIVPHLIPDPPCTVYPVGGC
ncbi:hypothetical protein SCLCIDRAFT_133193, partial [Scleroderma citrinum Foug A]